MASTSSMPVTSGSEPSLPVAGAIFSIRKPPGTICTSMLNTLKPLLLRSRLFISDDQIKEVIETSKPTDRGGRRRRKGAVDIKLGQGGTLDPNAEGVLVVGVGFGTRKLTDFLECDKEYEATVLLGSSTTTYDSEGSVLDRAPWEHVDEDAIRGALPKFAGEVVQIPPVYSALKMDGKPLHEYAREGKALPRPIDPRKVTVHSVELIQFTKEGHDYRTPSKELTQEEKEKLYKTLHSQPSVVDPLPTLHDASEIQNKDAIPPIFTLRVRCSGGTYIRSLVHDLCQTLGSAGHLVTLVRTRQGDWALESCVDWKDIEAGEHDKYSVPAGGPYPISSWEETIMKHWEVIGVRPPKKNVQGRREQMLATPPASASASKRDRETSPNGDGLEAKRPREDLETGAVPP